MPSADRLHDAERAKQAIRERVWALLEREGAARFPGARGRIPNFVGAEAAAKRLSELPPWTGARVVKANPDSPQLPVRARALAEGKLVYMAVPRLTDPKPFILLDPDRLKVPPRRAASIRGAAAAGRKVSIDEMQPVDLVVCGTVAVNRKGVRVGKGGGFSDLEFALLVEAGLITNDTQFTLTEFGRDQTRVQRKAPTAAEVALFGPDIPGDVTNINDSFFNLSRQRARGVDLDVRYDTDTWYWGMAAQRTTEFKQATFEEDPLESVLGIRAGDYSRPEWISNTWFGYTWADWTGEIMFRYKSSVEDSTTDPDDNVAFIPALKEFDAFIRYDGLKNMSVTFGCTNCSNEPPPFTYDEFEGYAVGYSDPRGAFWYLRLKYDLGSAMRARAR